MSTLGDQDIIDNTHFQEEDGRLICYTNLPNGERFAQAVNNQDDVRKNMIGWCNTVRDYLKVREAQDEEERQARKARRELEDVPAEVDEDIPPATTATSDGLQQLDAKSLVLEHYNNLEDARVSLIQDIDNSKGELLAIEQELDELRPVIQAWRGVKGE